MNPILSIIIPTYNRAAIIGQTLNSILDQDFSDWECIIVDDGSDDNTAEVVGKYQEQDARFQYFQRPKDSVKGPNTCRNYGFTKASGKYINWFDSDDLYKPGAFTSVIKTFLHETDVVVCKLEFIDFTTGLSIKESNIISNNILTDYYSGKITFYISGPFWNRCFLEKQSVLFDEKISNLDDWDFNLRMLYQNPDIAYINNSLIQYRIHENSLSKEMDKLNLAEIKSDLTTREKHLEINRKTKRINTKFITIDIRNKYRYFLRAILAYKKEGEGYVMRKLLVYEVKLVNPVGVIKTITGYLSYKLFNKGYKFFS